MKPIPGLDDLLSRAAAKGIFGTKERSVIGGANPAGIAAIVAQQFELAEQVLRHGLVPILEPEVTITISDKAAAEDILRDEITKHLDAVPDGRQVMLKLSLPTEANLYLPADRTPEGAAGRGAVRRLLAGPRPTCCSAQNDGLIASFSRALTEGLSAQQSDEEFNATLDAAIQSIYTASVDVILSQAGLDTCHIVAVMDFAMSAKGAGLPQAAHRIHDRVRVPRRGVLRRLPARRPGPTITPSRRSSRSSRSSPRSGGCGTCSCPRSRG